MTDSSPAPSITIGARSSPLSRAQVQEVQEALSPLQLLPVYVETRGDRDQQTSLRDLDKTDFFTRDIDTLQQNRGCRLSVHSAKDLPEPLPKGLVLAALTKGVDRSDSLVLSEGTSLSDLKAGARIAASSYRREEAVRIVKPDADCVDIRGNIGKRLDALAQREVDGVVIAEAALIRLGLSPNRVKLPGATTPLQGQLAILAREEDLEARLLVAPVDSRQLRNVLYLGLDPTHYQQISRRATILHLPVIHIQYHLVAPCHLQEATHVIFTSKTAVKALSSYSLKDKCLVAVGAVTAAHLCALGYEPQIVAEQETAEGVIEALESEDLSNAFVLWPHGNRARRLIADYLTSQGTRFEECIVYDTHLRCPRQPPPLDHIHEVVFTSPSTVDGFLACYTDLPNCRITAQGPVTRRYLEKHAATVDWTLSS